MTDKQIPNERRQYEYKSVFTYTDNTTDDNDKIMENLHKQIIIDGVDVSGCPCIQSNNIGDVICVKLARTSLYCKGQPCYYKALERKEQECEELKELVKKQKDVLIHKTILADEYESAYLFENTKVAKLKYSLNEIKEIAVHCMKQDICTTCDNSDKCHIEDEEIPTYDVCKLILQKISEVEDVANN